MKNSYILLRNNIESTPLYAEDLQRIGLKANDLVWVECQSVCWQNPHEIPELRPLVSGQANTVQEKKVAVTAEVQVQDAEAAQPTPTAYKSVFVKMPVSEETRIDSTTDNKKIVEPIADNALADMEKYGGITKTTDIPLIGKKESAAKTNHTRSLDEIKEKFVEKMEERGKDILEMRLSAQTKKILLYAGLVVTGALLMVLLKNFSSDKSPVVKMVPQQEEPLATSATPPPIYETETDSATIPESYETTIPAAEESGITKPERQQQPAVTNSKSAASAAIAIKEDKKTDAPEAKNGNAEKVMRPVIETKISKPVTMDEIAERLTLTANEYNVGSFGGIRNLKMTLHNNSKYLLDKVTVEIQYLNPEGVVLKTDNIHFQSLPPDDKATIAVDKTKRGVKVSYKILRIDSKEISHVTTQAAGDYDYTNK